MGCRDDNPFWGDQTEVGVRKVQAELEATAKDRDHWLAKFRDAVRHAVALEKTNADIKARVKELEEAPLNLPGVVDAAKKIESLERQNEELKSVLRDLIYWDEVGPGHITPAQLTEHIKRGRALLVKLKTEMGENQ